MRPPVHVFIPKLVAPGQRNITDEEGRPRRQLMQLPVRNNARSSTPSSPPLAPEAPSRRARLFKRLVSAASWTGCLSRGKRGSFTRQNTPDSVADATRDSTESFFRRSQSMGALNGHTESVTDSASVNAADVDMESFTRSRHFDEACNIAAHFMSPLNPRTEAKNQVIRVLLTGIKGAPPPPSMISQLQNSMNSPRIGPRVSRYETFNHIFFAKGRASRLPLRLRLPPRPSRKEHLDQSLASTIKKCLTTPSECPRANKGMWPSSDFYTPRPSRPPFIPFAVIPVREPAGNESLLLSADRFLDAAKAWMAWSMMTNGESVYGIDCRLPYVRLLPDLRATQAAVNYIAKVHTLHIYASHVMIAAFPFMPSNSSSAAPAHTRRDADPGRKDDHFHLRIEMLTENSNTFLLSSAQRLKMALAAREIELMFQYNIELGVLFLEYKILAPGHPLTRKRAAVLDVVATLGYFEESHLSLKSQIQTAVFYRGSPSSSRALIGYCRKCYVSQSISGAVHVARIFFYATLFSPSNLPPPLIHSSEGNEVMWLKEGHLLDWLCISEFFLTPSTRIPGTMSSFTFTMAYIVEAKIGTPKLVHFVLYNTFNQKLYLELRSSHPIPDAFLDSPRVILSVSLNVFWRGKYAGFRPAIDSDDESY